MELKRNCANPAPKISPKGETIAASDVSHDYRLDATRMSTDLTLYLEVV